MHVLLSFISILGCYASLIYCNQRCRKHLESGEATLPLRLVDDVVVKQRSLHKKGNNSYNGAEDIL